MQESNKEYRVLADTISVPTAFESHTRDEVIALSDEQAAPFLANGTIEVNPTADDSSDEQESNSGTATNSNAGVGSSENQESDGE